MISPIKGFEGLYSITSGGDVISHGGKSNHKKSIRLKPSSDKDGYLKVALKDKGMVRYARVHVLVAEAFIDNPLNLRLVNHKDEVKYHNDVVNLEWVDAYGNYKHSEHSMKSECKVTSICKKTAQEKNFKSLMDAARFYNINQGNITNCIKGRCKSVGGYYWGLCNG